MKNHTQTARPDGPAGAGRHNARQPWTALFRVAVVFCVAHFSTLLCLAGHCHAEHADAEQNARSETCGCGRAARQPVETNEPSPCLPGDMDAVPAMEWAGGVIAPHAASAGSAVIAPYAHGAEGLFKKLTLEALQYWAVYPA